jgi:hypothetical protein
MIAKGGLTMRTTVFVLALLLLSAGCGGDRVDWSQPETLILREKSRAPLRVDFKTLTSDFAFNDGSYTFESSPDGKRCLVHFTFLVKPAKGAGAPSQSAVTEATRESFAPAVGGVKKRAASLAVGGSR